MNGIDRERSDATAANGKPAKTFGEFFAGIGLIGEGLQSSGWRCVYAIDNDVAKQRLYEARNGPSRHFHLGDIRNSRDVLADMEEPPFLATASFPCVDLSLAGRYRGFRGEHSSTFFAFVDVLRALKSRRPRVVLLENVAGFLTAHGGRDFEAAILALAELGYRMHAFVLNAQHFLPQSRPRVFVVGAARDLVLAETGAAAVMPGSQLYPPALIRNVHRLERQVDWLRLHLPAPPTRSIALATVLDADTGQNWWNSADTERHYRMMSDRHRRQIGALLTRTALGSGPPSGEVATASNARRFDSTALPAVCERRAAAAPSKLSLRRSPAACKCGG